MEVGAQWLLVVGTPREQAGMCCRVFLSPPYENSAPLLLHRPPGAASIHPFIGQPTSPFQRSARRFTPRCTSQSDQEVEFYAPGFFFFSPPFFLAARNTHGHHVERNVAAVMKCAVPVLRPARMT